MTNSVPPGRLVIVGSGGFIGSAVLRTARRAGLECIGLSRADCNLVAKDANRTLSAHLRCGDTVVAVAAVAPCKDTEMLLANTHIVRSLERALASSQASRVINISSDAVYPDLPTPLDENVPPSPSSLHGAMHLMRETVVSSIGLPTLHVRPTLVYGPGDPHNGYGPNRFARQARSGQVITLFGEGEEQRDHVHVDDVAEIVVRAAQEGLTGTLNAACGQLWTFRALAEAICSMASSCRGVMTTPRNGPMPHGGFRPFSITHLQCVLPDVHPRTPAEGLASLISVKAEGTT